MLHLISVPKKRDVYFKILEGTWNNGSWRGHIKELTKYLNVLHFTAMSIKLTASRPHLSDVLNWPIHIWMVLKDDAEIASKANNKTKICMCDVAQKAPQPCKETINWKVAAQCIHRHPVNYIAYRPLGAQVLLSEWRAYEAPGPSILSGAFVCCICEGSFYDKSGATLANVRQEDLNRTFTYLWKIYKL